MAILKIGNLNLNCNLVLAPMSGVSDLPFRMLNRQFGCELAFVEMINARSLGHNSLKTQRLLSSCKEDRPLGVQILAGEIDHLKRGLDILQRFEFDILDFNAACPARKVVRRKEGAALLKDPQRLFQLLRVAVNSCKVPVTVKIRTGWDKDMINAQEIALLCEDAGVSAIFIHGRTKVQEYSGNVDYKTIGQVKKISNLPIVASGNIFNPALAKKMLEDTGCDGLLIARGAFGNPWIFGQIKQYLLTGKEAPLPSVEVIIETMKRHYLSCLNFYGPKLSVIIFRKFFSWYTKGFVGIRPLRLKANYAKTPEGLLRLIEECRLLQKKEQK